MVWNVPIIPTSTLMPVVFQSGYDSSLNVHNPIDQCIPNYGSSPSPQSLTATGDPQQAYAQGKQDAQCLRAAGINADFAPLADIYQGGAVDESRMFGATSSQVVTYAGAFLDGLQQNGVEGTLKHWPGLGSAPANPDFGLPTITKNQAQLNAVDFSSFRALLSHQPGMIMVTHVMVPAYDASEPASLSPVLIDQVLRGQLGYQGVVITDAMDAQGLIQYMQQQGYSDLGKAIAEASIRAILAGKNVLSRPIVWRHWLLLSQPLFNRGVSHRRVSIRHYSVS